MEKIKINEILPYLNTGNFFYVFDNPKYLTNFIKKYPDGIATIEATIDNFKEFILDKNYKLILKPISNLIKNNNLDRNLERIFSVYDDKYEIIDGFIEEVDTFDSNPYYFHYPIVMELIRNHYDVFCLIEKGFAINVNDFDVKIYD